VFKNALISVSEKAGLAEFLKPFVQKGLRVVSTGGTLKYLRDNDIPAIDISEQTGFPEVMDGRVKTLHPRVHMALLSRDGNSEDSELLRKEGLDPFDLLIVNLYPFEAASKKNLPYDELIEYIDIGGPSLLRAAAKNHQRMTVICEPEDYAKVASLVAASGELSLSDRRALAARVFRHTARYDDLIAKTLTKANSVSSENVNSIGDSSANDSLVGRLWAELRYGENPQQKAKWYRRPEADGGLHQAKILHGKPLSYNNILDLDAACACVVEFHSPAAVAVKHGNPCGVGTSSELAGAVHLALTADPLSVFGGIVALNRPLEVEQANELAGIFLECIVAPQFSAAALERLQKKKDLRLLQWPALDSTASQFLEFWRDDQFRSVAGGFLLQSSDVTTDWPHETSQIWSNDGGQESQNSSASWKIYGPRPSESIQRDLMLAWKVCARLKSNAIAIACAGQTVGLGMGQVNRVDAVQHAIERMQKHHPEVARSRSAVLASDAFFPFPDSIDLAADAGVKWIIQPGGSIRDEEVLARAKSREVNMVLTGTRHFRH
jgi:phosphoribosylaminoimidazolecarboxamide formyltransferase/IMP cyclohydrolase